MLRANYFALLSILLCSVPAVTSRAAEALPAWIAGEGLQAISGQLIIAEESALADRAKTLKSAQAKYLDAYRDAFQAEQKLLFCIEEYVAAEAAIQQIMRATSQRQYSTSDERQLRQRIDEVHSLLVSDRQETDVPFAALMDARGKYILAIRSANEAAEVGVARYNELAANQQVKTAIDEFNSSASKKLTLGPTRVFTNNASSVVKYKGLIRTDTIPIRVQDGIVHADVSIDGKTPVDFILDPSAAKSRICFDTRKALGIEDELSFPRLRFPSTTSNIGWTPGTAVPFQSIRLGEFEVRDSIAIVYWAVKDISDSRLGSPFFRNFEWHINLESRSLTLTEINDPLARKMTEKVKKKRR